MVPAEAAYGEEALAVMGEQFAAGRPYRLVLLDEQMPVMDGFEATRRIRNAERGMQNAEFKNESLQSSIVNHQSSMKRIPIVAMTAHAMKGDRERCLEAGMDDYVSKPIKAEEFLAVIEKVTHQSKDTKEKAGETSCALRTDEPPSKDVFDLAGALEVVGGDKDLFKEISTMFLEGLPGYIGQIGEGVHDNCKTINNS